MLRAVKKSRKYFRNQKKCDKISCNLSHLMGDIFYTIKKFPDVISSKNMFSFSPPSSLLYAALDRPSFGPWRDLDQDPHWATLWEDSWIWIWLYTENVDSYLDLGWILKQKISFYSKSLRKLIFWLVTLLRYFHFFFLHSLSLYGMWALK